MSSNGPTHDDDCEPPRDKGWELEAAKAQCRRGRDSVSYRGNSTGAYARRKEKDGESVPHSPQGLAAARWHEHKGVVTSKRSGDDGALAATESVVSKALLQSDLRRCDVRLQEGAVDRVL
jgi:hypothetical protein